jgi:hypothetical protein
MILVGVTILSCLWQPYNWYSIVTQGHIVSQWGAARYFSILALLLAIFEFSTPVSDFSCEQRVEAVLYNQVWYTQMRIHDDGVFMMLREVLRTRTQNENTEWKHYSV